MYERSASGWLAMVTVIPAARSAEAELAPWRQVSVLALCLRLLPDMNGLGA